MGFAIKRFSSLSSLKHLAQEELVIFKIEWVIIKSLEAQFVTNHMLPNSVQCFFGIAYWTTHSSFGIGNFSVSLVRAV